ncbi:MAG: response regulator [Chitinophagaceae bacterium]|nr:MAG: response regulator [Chitinophagaceae bacterium]
MSTTFLKRKTLVVLAVLWSCLRLNAQEGTGFETISTAQGLSQGMIFGMLQDQEGFIWVATKEGLNRYDGYNFRVFTTDPGNPYSLSSNYIRSVFEDSKGYIWAATLDAGLNVYDKKTGRFHRIMNKQGDRNSLSGNRMRSGIIELPDGRIMVAPENEGINLITLNDDFFAKDSPPVIQRFNLPGNEQPSGIGKDDKGKIWVGCTDKKIYVFDPSGNFRLLSDGKTFTTALATVGTKLWASRDVLVADSMTVYRPFDTTFHFIPGTMVRDQSGRISVGPIGLIPPGVAHSHCYDFTGSAPGKPVSTARNYIFTSSKIKLQVLMVDRSGIIWAGTSGLGINKYNLASTRFHHLLPGFSVRSIIPIGPTQLYVAGWDRDWWINTTGEQVSKPLPSGLGPDSYDNFVVTKNGDYWLWKNDEKKLYRYNSKPQVLASMVLNLRGAEDKQPMYEDRKGNIWICGLSGDLVRVSPTTGKVSYFSINTDPSKSMLANAQSNCFYEDATGVIWIGTEEGFVKLAPGEGNIQPAVTWYRNHGPGSLNYNYVSCFLDDPADNRFLWICTKGGGLNRMEKATGKFDYLTTRDGLPNDIVYGILADDMGNIWGSTNRGIFCLLAAKKGLRSRSFRNFSKSDGLQGEEFNTGGFVKLPSGELLFGGVNGLNIFNPAEILAPGYQPNVFITSLLIDNKDVVPGDNTGVLGQTIEKTSSITLSHLQDILTLEFSSLDFTSAAQNKYRYQLAGIDDNWVESNARRSATYLHLPAGRYTFRVQASNSQGEWSSHIAELRIRVLPPWWLTWWAWIIYALVLGFCIRAWFRFSINRARLRSQLNFEKQEARRVKELDNVKTQLYTNITHEFRTPLTVIMGMAQQLIKQPDEQFRQRMDMIVRNGQNLLDLVNEMLDLSKLETGKMQLQITHGDVLLFLRYIVESFNSLAISQRKKLFFLTGLESLQVGYDAEKLRQIVANLLSNALKFTPENGTIYITVGKNEIPHDEPNVTLIIKVKDNGIGIPEDELENVFDRFYQLDNSSTRKADGTGIGLALTRELVKLMEGEIIVKSPPTGADKGSEFTVILPLLKTHVMDETLVPAIATLQLTDEIKENNIQSRNANPDDTRPMILLVEDNPDVVAYTASCLSGYRLAVGQDGREGFDLAKELVPDLVITDVMMPFVDGFELCRKLRADEKTSHIPVIMLTAKADLGSRIEGLEQGADVYLEKPFNPEELLVRIKKLLELRQRLRQHYLRTAGIEETVTEQITGPEMPVPETPIEDSFVTRVREAIEQHVDNPDFTVEQLCRMVFMSHSQLHRKLDALTGLSPNKFIRLIRLNQSKELLKVASNSIASVALDCGYNDPGYFARVFKQEFGCTPQEWRANETKAGQLS